MIKLMSHKVNTWLVLAAVLLGCQNLDTVNLNEPDESRSLATASDIESLIKGSFHSWFTSVQGNYPSNALSMITDLYVDGWGNWGMSYISRVPRVEFENSTSAGVPLLVQDPWFGLYGAISAASDGIRNIKEGTVSLGDDNERALAFGKFVQGLSHAWLAANFDQAFVLDENVDLVNDELVLQPYTEVMTVGIQQLEDAIAMMNANTFTIPADWINGRTYSNTELAQLAHSFIAHYLASEARTPAERQALAWNTIVSHADQGFPEDWGPSGNGGARNDVWFNSLAWFSQLGSVPRNEWTRVGYKAIGPSDRGTGYEDWLATPHEQREEFLLDSGDLRVWDGTLAADGTPNSGSQFSYAGTTTYVSPGFLKSLYQHDVHIPYWEAAALGPAIMFRRSELDFLKAEALLHTGGSQVAIAALLDKTHVQNGGYPSVTEAPAIGSMSDKPDPKPGATVWSIFKYEKNLELMGTFSGGRFFDVRAWGDLEPGTLLHFPVPAQDLETLQLDIYSFGGGGVGSANKRAARRKDVLRHLPPN